ncbi:MAG: hypothetical protein OSB65_15110 [Roseibacillus sp.]|jgi:hypothetical protein|nr:hypothetical protein [Roseibacillus sp.]
MPCWSIVLKCFSSIDREHGEILTFPKVTWTAIAKSPIRYLEAQGQDGGGAAHEGKHVGPNHSWSLFGS